MQNHTKREIILDAMQELMNGSSAQAISVSDIAQKAGIGKEVFTTIFLQKMISSRPLSSVPIPGPSRRPARWQPPGG